MNTLPFVLFGWAFFCGFTTMAFGLITAFHTSKVMRYLKEHQYTKWRELTSIGQFGPGLSNPFNVWAYLHSESDTNDEYLLRIRDKARIWWRNFLLGFLTYVCSMIAVAAIMILFVAK